MKDKKCETAEHLVAYLQVEEHYVASLDILGAKKYIYNDAEHKKLNLIYSTFQKAKSQLENENPEIKKWLNQAECKIFSDNIIIYLKSLNGQGNKAVFQPNYFLNLVRRIQRLFLEEKLLVRGGITIGEFFGDDMMVWGKALVEAYKLESKHAIYPRVILSDDYIKKIGDIAKVQDITLLDNDGIYYLDIIYFCNELNNQFSSLTPDQKKDRIKSELDCNIKDKASKRKTMICNTIEYFEEENTLEEDETIREKYAWIISYLNRKLSFLNEVLEICTTLEKQKNAK